MDGRTEEATLSPAEVPSQPLPDVEDPSPLQEQDVEDPSPLQEPNVEEPLPSSKAPGGPESKAPGAAGGWTSVRRRLENLQEKAGLGPKSLESLEGSGPLSPGGSQGSGHKQRVSIAEPEEDGFSLTEPSALPVIECVICRHLLSNYVEQEELDNGANNDPRIYRAPFAQYWREKEMVEDKQIAKSRPGLCRFHTLYKERHDFLTYILEQRRQHNRLSSAELAAMQKIDVPAANNDDRYLSDVEAIVKDHFKVSREAVMRGLAGEARQLQSHWENIKDRQDQEIVEDLSKMQKRHQSELAQQRTAIRSALGRKKLHYSSELLSSFENEKHLLAKRDWAQARDEATRASQVEKQARHQFNVDIKEESQRRETWVRTLLERQKRSRIDHCAHRRQMGALARAADGERLYQRLNQTTQRLAKAHDIELKKVRAHFAEHCSRMSHIVERTARGSGGMQEVEQRRPLYESPVRVPFKPEKTGTDSTQRPKSAGAKVNMTRSLPGEFASKIMAEEMRIAVHRKLAAASRSQGIRRSGSAPNSGFSAPPNMTKISAARPPSANSRLPLPQRMGGHLLQRPRSAGLLGRQPWSQETGEKGQGIYGTQWTEIRNALRCDFCGKRASKPRVLPASKMEPDSDAVCVGCSWECLRQWNAKISPPFLREERADMIQDLAGQEALSAAEGQDASH